MCPSLIVSAVSFRAREFAGRLDVAADGGRPVLRLQSVWDFRFSCQQSYLPAILALLVPEAVLETQLSCCGYLKISGTQIAAIRTFRGAPGSAAV